jgi:hypothetical protein
VGARRAVASRVGAAVVDGREMRAPVEGGMNTLKAIQICNHKILYEIEVA